MKEPFDGFIMRELMLGLFTKGKFILLYYKSVKQLSFFQFEVIADSQMFRSLLEWGDVKFS